MGYRPTIITEKIIEYGETIPGFNWKVNEFITLLNDLKIDYNHYQADNAETFEILSSQLLKLKDKDLTQIISNWLQRNLTFESNESYLDYIDAYKASLQIIIDAYDTPVAKRTGYVIIEWF